MTKIKIHLDPVQETLLIPLWSRAVETQSARPILQDPYATEFLDRIEYDLTKIEQEFAKVQPIWPIRAYTFDQVVRNFIAQHPQASIVSPVATRPVTSPPLARWMV